jgi:hypothetical protein
MIQKAGDIQVGKSVLAHALKPQCRGEGACFICVPGCVHARIPRAHTLCGCQKESVGRPAQSIAGQLFRSRRSPCEFSSCMVVYAAMCVMSVCHSFVSRAGGRRGRKIGVNLGNGFPGCFSPFCAQRAEKSATCCCWPANTHPVCALKLARPGRPAGESLMKNSRAVLLFWWNSRECCARLAIGSLINTDYTEHRGELKRTCRVKLINITHPQPLWWGYRIFTTSS